jgi:hypothetical protein
MQKLTVLLLMTCGLLMGVAQAAPSATLTWTAPTANTDGSAITGTLTYNIYQALQGVPLSKVSTGNTALSVVVTAGLTAGTTQCFAVTAVEGTQEGAQSSIGCKTFPSPTPLAPVLISVK